MGYTGCKNLEDFQTKTNFIKITAASKRKSHTHDVVVTREAPNYPTKVNISMIRVIIFIGILFSPPFS